MVRKCEPAIRTRNQRAKCTHAIAAVEPITAHIPKVEPISIPTRRRTLNISTPPQK
jgi:hypothetical protein